MTQTLNQGFNIAKKVLRGQYCKNGILAGATHFKDVWARDSFFASLGALALGDYNIVKKNLELFLKNQKNGQIPLRIGRNNFLLPIGFLGIPLRIRIPIFKQDKGSNSAIDPNTLLIIAFREYYKATKDKTFLKQNLHKLEKAIQWLKTEDGLIKEKQYGGWADSIKKQGYVLYSNVCYAHALFSLSELFSEINKIKKAEEYLKKFKKTKEKINNKFWNGRYYIDWIDNKAYDFFSTDGNLLAIIWGIANQQKSKSIEKTIEAFKINEFVPSSTNYPKYPKEYISPFIRFFGLKDYHNGMSWAWLGALDAIAKYKLGMKNQAKEILEKIADVFVKNNNVHEIYEKNKPVRRLFYKSERNFAWSAGLFVLAYKTIQNRGR